MPALRLSSWASPAELGAHTCLRTVRKTVESAPIPEYARLAVGTLDYPETIAYFHSLTDYEKTRIER